MNNGIKYVKIDINFNAENGNSPVACTVRQSEIGKGYNICKGFVPNLGFDFSNISQIYLSKNIKTYMNVYALG